jgi:ferredoxin
MPKVKFYKEKVEIEVEQGANLRQAALAAGIEVYAGIEKLANCLGNGLCGTCRVLLMKDTVKNTNPQTIRERVRFKTSFLNIGDEAEMRLSCQTKVEGDIEVFTQPSFNWAGKPDKQPMPVP